jgi:lipopolysaccharide export system protein LptC
LTAISETNLRTAPVFSRSGSISEGAFRRASRHSRHVRLLRMAVPGAVVLAVVGALVFPAFVNPIRALSKMPVDIGSIVVSGTKIMMQQPRLAGFTRDNRRYDLTAQAAGQDVTKPDMVELQAIHATMESQDDAIFEMSAQNGLYNSKTELLTLSTHIVLTSTTGYEAMLSEAVVDIRAGKIVSEQPVVVKTSTLNINANRMEVSDGGDFMRFDRGVTVLLLPESTTHPGSTTHFEARSR